MAQNTRLRLLATVLALVFSACTFPPTTTTEPPVPEEPVIPESNATVTLELTISANTSTPFDKVGQAINYSYLIKNTGNQSVPGPASVADDKRTPVCPDITTIGNGNANLDPTEEITCTGTYTITQADLDAGSVTNNVTATVGGATSNAASFSVNLTQNKALTLTKAANPTTFNQVGQIITYTFVILNSGNVTLQGPFSIADDKVLTANCTQPDDAALSPNDQMSCTATYSITQADLVAGSVTNNASASNGTITSANASYTINKPSSGPPPSYGTTIQHRVEKGEWLWQIARCYGASPKEVIDANPQLYHPAELLPGMIVTVPNVGSRGTIYDRPCVYIYTVQSGDTWESIAQKFNADIAFLKWVNPGGLSPGREIKVPKGKLNP